MTGDINFKVGAQWKLEVSCVDADGNPLTGLTSAEWRVVDPALGRMLKATYGVQQANAGGNNVTGGQITFAAGVATVTISSALQQQAGLVGGKWYSHELWVTDSNGVDSVQSSGYLTVQHSLKEQYP